MTDSGRRPTTPARALRVLVMTVVHHPEDARITHRQITALIDRGHRVTLAAPYTGFGVTPRATIEAIDLPRACGRRRATAVRAARDVLRRERDRHDLVLLHDPELLLALPGRTPSTPVVWDVHEDTANALGLKPWLPRAARPVTSAAVRVMESMAERRIRLLLAEHGYAERFGRAHPVVPNEPWVPATVEPPGVDRVVHLGHLSAARGAAELLDVARLLRPHGVTLELIGPADNATAPMIRAAARTGLLRWTGFLPNDAALLRVRGALAGLCLLQNAPNYRVSMPTKVLEYMAHGVPVVTSPLPLAAETVRRHRCGTVVPFDNPEAVARAVLRLREDGAGRELAAERGYDAARRLHDWNVSGQTFVDLLESWAKVPETRTPRLARGLRPSRLVSAR